jgi:hypothetical protein
MTLVLIIADATESAAACWPKTARAIAGLLVALPAGSVAGVALLGTELMWPAEAWQPGLPLPTEASGAGSFVAPVMAGVKTRRLNPRWGVIAGSGEVFDLPDWTAAGLSWALLRTGEASLQAADGRIAEFAAADGLAALASLLGAEPQIAPRRVQRELTGAIKQRWALDPTGYPMIYVPPLAAFLHLFPVAKPQFEAFLAAAPSPARGDAWYGELLALNPRLSPWAPSLASYEHLFVTGLLPDEAQALTAYLGPDFCLPGVESWRTAYAWLAGQELSVPPAVLEYDLAPAARRLWHGLLAAIQPRTLLDLSLMQGGVVEWVTAPDGRLVALGKPRDAFDPNFRDPLRDRPWEPTTPVRRSKRFGVRLLRTCAS